MMTFSVLLFLIGGVAGAEAAPPQVEFNEKISNWEKALAEIVEKEKTLATLYNSPSAGERMKKEMEMKINFPALQAIIKNAKSSGSFKNKEEEDGDIIAGQIKDGITRLGALTDGTGLITFAVSPIDGRIVLPFDAFVPGEISNEIKVMATPGEYEPASFVLYCKADLNGLTLKAGDLQGVQGIIPSSSVDLKVVKCWYQTGINWNTGSFLGFTKVLVPELLLNDDSLVKVDLEKEENYLKTVSPEGEKYIWISNPNEVKKNIYTVDEFPANDSPVLLPVNIPARTNKQFWVTVKVPEDAAEGIYTGSISLSSGEKKLGAVTLKLQVLPFKLAPPKTYYDTRRDFTSSIYYMSCLNWNYPKGTIYVAPGNEVAIWKSREQIKSELKDMFAHGVTNPMVLQYFVNNKAEELLREYLDIRNEVGMGKQPLYYMGYYFGVPAPEALPALKEGIKKTIDFFKSYGIPEVYFYGKDEAMDEQVTAQRPAWEAVREAGGKIWVSGYRAGVNGNKKGNFELAGDILDLFVSAGEPVKEEADKWHSVNHLIWCYANPQAGSENPVLFRKGFGFPLWKANYDGACTWVYNSGSWNDFLPNLPDGKIYSFTYPTVNGTIDTIAWEGYREAIDDIRYGSTLKLLIEKAKKGESNTEIAKKAEEYLENLDVKDKKPDLIRSEIIDYILKLR